MRMQLSGKETALFFLRIIPFVLSTVTAETGNYFIRRVTNITSTDIITSVMAKSKISCVLSCQLSASCQIPAFKYEDVNSMNVQGDFECLHIDQTKSSQGEKNISVMVLAVHSLISMSLRILKTYNIENLRIQ